jgi:hypothetical protein
MRLPAFVPAVIAIGVGLLLACPPAEAGRLFGRRHQPACACPVPCYSQQDLDRQIDLKWYQFHCVGTQWVQIGNNSYLTHDDAMNDTPDGFFQFSGEPWWVCQKSLIPRSCNANTLNPGFNDVCPVAVAGAGRPNCGCQSVE